MKTWIGRLHRLGDERAYVMPLTALALVPLLLLAGLAVDVGGWYASGSRLQRAADAAALAGVVWLPDTAKAYEAALDELARNGIDVSAGSCPAGPDYAGKAACSADGQLSVSLDSGDQQLEVLVTDHSVTGYFHTLVSDEIEIGRRAIAEYVLPVPLGSPESRFGTGDLAMGGVARNFWAAVSGFCTAKEDGDRLLARYDGNARDGCPPGPGYPNPPHHAGYAEDQLGGSYDPEGYDYVVEVPSGRSQPIHVQLFDAAPSCSSSAGDVTTYGSMTTQFTLHDPNLAVLSDDDDLVVGTFVVGPADTATCGAWHHPPGFTIPVDARAGRWRLNVRTLAGDGGGRHNMFGIWAQRGSETTACDGRFDSTCPRVSGRDFMSINVNDSAGTGASTFFLAEIDEEHAGKTAVVQLWDTAEGMDFLQILGPDGDPVDFVWRGLDADGRYGSPSSSAPGCGSPDGPCLDVSGTGPQPGPNRLNDGKFNGRLLELRIDLPTDLSSYPGSWWSIRYQGSAVRDRTTWSVVIEGDPVHLVEEL